MEALALGSSFIEELSQLPFDEASWDSTSYSKSVSDFTQANSLGPESGETSADLFDDFDDYHNYTRIDSTQQNVYSLKSTVVYVNENNPESTYVGRSLYKKLMLDVIDHSTSDTTKIHYVHGYWYFN